MHKVDAEIEDLRTAGMLPQPEHRFSAHGELSWRFRLMAWLMVHGSTDAAILSFVRRVRRTREDGKSVFHDEPPPAIGEPLPADEACLLAGVRRRYARELVKTEVFHAALREARAGGGYVRAVPDGDVK